MSPDKSAMDRIDEIRSTKRYDSLNTTPKNSPGEFLHQDKEFLLRAFDVARSIAIEIDLEDEFEKEFEKRMKALNYERT